MCKISGYSEIATLKTKKKAVHRSGAPPCNSLALFAVAITALVVSAVVRIHLVGAIIVVRSVRWIVRVVLIRVVIKLNTGMSITRYTFSFAHDINLLVSSDFIITQDRQNRHERVFKTKSTLNRGCFR